MNKYHFFTNHLSCKCLHDIHRRDDQILVDQDLPLFQVEEGRENPGTSMSMKTCKRTTNDFNRLINEKIWPKRPCSVRKFGRTEKSLSPVCDRTSKNLRSDVMQCVGLRISFVRKLFSTNKVPV